MNYHVTQSIHIHSIKINTITNSSVFQIGSTGIIKSLAPNGNPSIPPKGTETSADQTKLRSLQISKPANLMRNK